MKKIIPITAGILLVTAAAVALYSWPYLSAWLRMPRLAGEMESANMEYRVLDREFPFDSTKIANLTSGQVARFVSCRWPLKAFMKDWEDDFESMMPLRLKTVRNAVTAVDLCRRHLESLRSARMSPAEYRWITERILLVLGSGNSEDVSEIIRSLRGEFDETRIQLRLHPSGTDFTWSYMVPGQPMKDLWKELPSTEAVPPQAEFEAVTDHAEGIRKTMPLFGQFDMEFLKHDYQAEQGIESSR